ncbi:uncharacterized protein LOC132547032 [Ylistrum balloti]|uniref:uncharacterized protein LOC132547032 n=1 Tax=Ylistrum balloti TaxID=509963 RepID=UPI002905F77F|nr:uncharacterized protein LOC132547032 [Ylistrum balloti]
MEYIKKLLFVLCLSLVTVVVLCDNEPETKEDSQQNCRKCKSGYFAILKCNDKHDTVCAACPEDSFTSSLNLQEKCNLCSTCSDGYFVITPCSKHTDTVCESCLSVKDSILPSFQERCIGTGVFSPPEPEHRETLVIPEAEGSADGGEEIYLGAEFQAPVLDNTDEILNASHIIKGDENEGSGDEVELNIGAQEEPNIETDSTTTLSPQKDTTNEGIGKNITQKLQTTTTRDTELPDDAGSDEFIPMTTTISTSSSKSTKPNLAQMTTKQNVVTTAGLIRIGEGIFIKPETEVELTPTKGSADPYEVLYTAAPRHKDNRVHHHHVENNLDKPVPTAEQKIGAQSQPKTEDASKVTIGVVIAVAVAAAFVFFILGFIVSVRCRRSREKFQVMKKVDKNGSWNSNSPVPIAIEYRDEEHSDIYDDIDKETARHHRPSGRPVKQEHIIPKHVEDLYAVPDKKKKSKDPEPPLAQMDRIRFIDETTDDEFGAKDEEILGLLRKSREGLINDHNGSLPRLDDSDSGADVGPTDTPPVEKSHQQGEAIDHDTNVIIEEEEEEENDDESESTPMLTNEASQPLQDASDSNEDK